ncbi:hypothetical protein Droror1_Dr00001255 [Drosera rotundifolia]
MGGVGIVFLISLVLLGICLVRVHDLGVLVANFVDENSFGFVTKSHCTWCSFDGAIACARWTKGSGCSRLTSGFLTSIRSKKRKTRKIALDSFIGCLLSEHEDFNRVNQQDAQEFLNVLLNKLVDLEWEFAAEVLQDKELFVHKVFQTLLSLTALKTTFPQPLYFGQNGKDCDKCGRLQDAEKRTTIKKAPQILVLHLKHFESTNQGSSQKLDYRVAYPLELKLTNTTEAADTDYSLSAVGMHLGETLESGHYVCMAKTRNYWLYFDDEEAEIIDESFVHYYFGCCSDSCVSYGAYGTDHHLKTFCLVAYWSRQLATTATPLPTSISM